MIDKTANPWVALGKMGANLFKYKPSVDLYSIRGALAKASKNIPAKGFKASPLNVKVDVPSMDGGKLKWYDPRKMISEPYSHIKEIQQKGVKQWGHNQLLSMKYAVDPKTGVVSKRSVGGMLAQPALGGGMVGGVGMGAFGLASGETPGQAFRSTVSWGMAPSASGVHMLGKMGYDFLKNKKAKNINFN